MRLRSLIAAVAIGCIAMPDGLSAQSVGALVGANISTISDASDGVEMVGSALNKKKRVGLKAGLYLKIPLAGMFSLEPELLYAQNGVTYEATAPMRENFAIDLGYVEVPVLLRVDLMPQAQIHPMLVAGASGAYRVQCKFDAPSGASTVKQDCDAGGDEPDPIKKSDYSLIGGVGLSGKLAGLSASLQLRVSQGLTSISTVEMDTSKPKNRAFSVLLGLMF